MVSAADGTLSPDSESQPRGGTEATWAARSSSEPPGSSGFWASVVTTAGGRGLPSPLPDPLQLTHGASPEAGWLFYPQSPNPQTLFPQDQRCSSQLPGKSVEEARFCMTSGFCTRAPVLLGPPEPAVGPSRPAPITLGLPDSTDAEPVERGHSRSRHRSSAGHTACAKDQAPSWMRSVHSTEKAALPMLMVTHPGASTPSPCGPGHSASTFTVPPWETGDLGQARTTAPGPIIVQGWPQPSKAHQILP